MQKRPVVTDEEAEVALHQLHQTVDLIALARGRMIKAEAMLKHIKAVATMLSHATSVSARENEALASDRYKLAIEDYSEAAIAFERAKAERENNAMVLECWRSSSANQRAARI